MVHWAGWVPESTLPPRTNGKCRLNLQPPGPDLQGAERTKGRHFLFYHFVLIHSLGLKHSREKNPDPRHCFRDISVANTATADILTSPYRVERCLIGYKYTPTSKVW